jgi:nucleobase:cation symporter-1, NCS1 family
LVSLFVVVLLVLQRIQFSRSFLIFSRIGAMYHVPFPVVARVSFGMWGCIPAILVRTFVALMVCSRVLEFPANDQWTAITTVQGGGYLENMVTAIWPSYANFPNKLPASIYITSGSLLMVFLYWFVQTAVSCLPMYRLRYFFRFKAIVVPPAFFALFLWG